MQDIKVGRYNPEECYAIGPDGERESIGYGGWVEDHDMTWIIFLDEQGRPKLYWSERDELGGVLGDPVELVA